MKRDSAAFGMSYAQAVWGNMPLCVLTLRHDLIDLQHIMGRGNNFGAGAKYDNNPKIPRRAFSSMYNCIPLHRHIHAGPMRDHRLMRGLFLEIAQKRVDNAVGVGDYQIREEDMIFRRFVSDWLQQNL